MADSLPTGWEVKTDEESGRPYYAFDALSIAQWHAPSATHAAACAAVAAEYADRAAGGRAGPADHDSEAGGSDGGNDDDDDDGDDGGDAGAGEGDDDGGDGASGSATVTVSTPSKKGAPRDPVHVIRCCEVDWKERSAFDAAVRARQRASLRWVRTAPADMGVPPQAFAPVFVRRRKFGRWYTAREDRLTRYSQQRASHDRDDFFRITATFAEDDALRLAGSVPSGSDATSVRVGPEKFAPGANSEAAGSCGTPRYCIAPFPGEPGAPLPRPPPSDGAPEVKYPWIKRKVTDTPSAVQNYARTPLRLPGLLPPRSDGHTPGAAKLAASDWAGYDVRPDKVPPDERTAVRLLSSIVQARMQLCLGERWSAEAVVRVFTAGSRKRRSPLELAVGLSFWTPDGRRIKSKQKVLDYIADPAGDHFATESREDDLEDSEAERLDVTKKRSVSAMKGAVVKRRKRDEAAAKAPTGRATRDTRGGASGGGAAGKRRRVDDEGADAPEGAQDAAAAGSAGGAAEGADAP